MGWARFDDCYSDHPKIVAAGALAELLDVRAILYSARYETDGRIAREALPRLSSGIPSAKKRAEKLVEVGRWRATADGWEIVDYLDYNPSHADREAERTAARERMQRARSAKRSPEQTANIVGTSPDGSADVRVTPSRPVPIDNSSPNVSTTRPEPRTDDEVTLERVIERIADSRSFGKSSAYRAKVRENLRTELDLDRLRRLIADHPTAPLEMLAGAALGEPTPYLAHHRRPPEAETA